MDNVTGRIVTGQESSSIVDILGLDEFRAKNVYYQKIKDNDYDFRVCRIHFFYFKIEKEKLVARHYLDADPSVDPNLWTDFFHEIVAKPYPDKPGRKRVSVTERLASLIENARKLDGGTQPPPSSNSVNRIPFRERSFLAFCFDHDGWEFPTDRGPGEDSTELPAIYFSDGAGLSKNHSFFDGRTAQLTIDGKVRPVFYMVNHSKKANGGDLTDTDNDLIKFNIVVKVPMSGSSERLTVIFDPGGNNLGPPKDP